MLALIKTTQIKEIENEYKKEMVRVTPARLGDTTGSGGRDGKNRERLRLCCEEKIRGQVLIILIALTCLQKSCISIYYYASQLADTPMGRKKYKSYLDYLAESNTEQAAAKFKHLCRGWALVTRNFKSALLEKKQIRWIESVGREIEEARHLYWESLLKQLLAYYGKSRSNILSEKKSASWKVMIAYYMKKSTSVSNTWLGELKVSGTFSAMF